MARMPSSRCTGSHTSVARLRGPHTTTSPAPGVPNAAGAAGAAACCVRGHQALAPPPRRPTRPPMAELTRSPHLRHRRRANARFVAIDDRHDACTQLAAIGRRKAIDAQRRRDAHAHAREARTLQRRVVVCLHVHALLGTRQVQTRIATGLEKRHRRAHAARKRCRLRIGKRGRRGICPFLGLGGARHAVEPRKYVHALERDATAQVALTAPEADGLTVRAGNARPHLQRSLERAQALEARLAHPPARRQAKLPQHAPGIRIDDPVAAQRRSVLAHMLPLASNDASMLVRRATKRQVRMCATPCERHK